MGMIGGRFRRGDVAILKKIADFLSLKIGGTEIIDSSRNLSNIVAFDGSGDLTMGTITMPGFSVDADGDTVIKSLQGPAGGLTIRGGTGSGDDLLLVSTTFPSKGDIQFHSGSYFISSTGALTVGAITSGAIGSGDITISDATPVINFKDTNAAAGDVNASIQADATDTGNGTEDVDVTFQQQVAGTPTIFFVSDADGSITIGAVGQAVALNTAALSGITTLDGTGDLTMGTITMPGFSVDADGDTTVKSLITAGTVDGVDVSAHDIAETGVHGAGANTLEHTGNKNIANGYTGLDANIRISKDRLPSVLRSGMIGNLAWAEMVVVQGTWAIYEEVTQTDWDELMVNAAGFSFNDTTADLDEFKLPSLTLNAGTYEIKYVGISADCAGILEVLHGDTSIGTFDFYAADAIVNKVATFTYSPTARTVADLRFRVNGKNLSSMDYSMYCSRIQIRKTV